MNKVEQLAVKARKAAAGLTGVSTATKNKALRAMAKALLEGQKAILNANAKDMKAAKARGISGALLDRLMLDEARVKDMAVGLRDIAKLPDPVGGSLEQWTLTNGLKINKVRVPIGVVGIVYEARPNVTADCTGLCLKSGNAVILRGGSEAIHSNRAIYKILAEAAQKAGLPDGTINLVWDTDRKSVDQLLSAVGLVDVVIPRGGEGLIRRVVEKARIPVIKQYKGVCHTFVDAGANLKMAEDICFNAKVQRPGVCNAMETMLVHKKSAKQFLPKMAKRFNEAGVTLIGDDASRKILKDYPIKKANKNDWDTEYLDLKLSVRVVDSLDDALAHIQQHGSNHSDAIVTKSEKNAKQFLQAVDSACVYVNASTRFTDGGQFGLGAEVGVSTDKLHARGPMGVEGLTTYKYAIQGKGQIRS